MSFRVTNSFIWTLIVGTLFISCDAESEDREKLVYAFQENFGFTPPNSVKDIKLKNWGLYDATAHWMAFTYDSNTLSRIIAHDQPLKVASNNSSEFFEIVKAIEKNAHHPKWLGLPNVETELIYYKRNFLNHSYSEYYLWTNKEAQMTFFYVHYFD